MEKREKLKGDEAAFQVLSEIDQYVFNYASERTSQNLHELISFWDKMDQGEKIDLARRIDAKDIARNMDGSKGTIGGTMITTVLILRLLGLHNIAGRMEYLTHASIMHANLRDTIDEIKVKGAVSKMNSNNASGAKNAKHDECIAIMMATWAKYPNGSKNRMVELIFSHFGGKVSRETLHRWIKQNGFGPQKIIRPAPQFQLVIPS